jgi:hypothetical protein
VAEWSQTSGCTRSITRAALFIIMDRKFELYDTGRPGAALAEGGPPLRATRRSVMPRTSTATRLASLPQAVRRRFLKVMRAISCQAVRSTIFQILTPNAVVLSGAVQLRMLQAPRRPRAPHLALNPPRPFRWACRHEVGAGSRRLCSTRGNAPSPRGDIEENVHADLWLGQGREPSGRRSE